MAKEMDKRIIGDFVDNGGVDFVTSVPCKQLAGGVIEVLDQTPPSITHVPSNKEDEGMGGLCAGAFMGGMRPPAIFMQNTALGGVVVNTLATLIQFYQIPLPMLISYRGEVGEPVACQVEMALHTKRS